MSDRRTWADFEREREPQKVVGADTIDDVCARVFMSADGQALLTFMRRATREAVLNPAFSESALWFLEGQRHLVAQLEKHMAAGLRAKRKTE
jgi:hypothetical protein